MGTEDDRLQSFAAAERRLAEAGDIGATDTTAGHDRLPERWDGDALEREQIAALVRSAPGDKSQQGGPAVPILDDAALGRLDAATPAHRAVRDISRELKSVPPGLRARVLSLYLAGYVAHHLCTSCRDAVGLPPTGQSEVAPFDCARCAAVSIATALGAPQRASLDSERTALARRMRREHERSRTLIERSARLRADGDAILRKSARPVTSSTTTRKTIPADVERTSE